MPITKSVTALANAGRYSRVHFALLCAALLVVACQQTPSSQEGQDDKNEHSAPAHSATQAVTSTTQPPQNDDSEPNQHSVTVEYTNLWQKIAENRNITIPPHSEVAFFREQFAARALFPTNATTAAKPWMYHIVSELEEREMPLELALLPLIESGFQPGIKGVGVAGMWQLSKSTALGQRIRVSHEYDGRLDPIPATRAALDYLLYLYEMFNNDWLSAVAAYNMGEGKLKSAIERNRRQGKPEDFLSLGLNKNQAPSLYKWLAVIEIVRDPAILEPNFPAIPNQAVLARDGIPNGVSLSSVAEAIAMPKAELQALNPAFKTRVVPSSGKYMINLPLEQAAAFELARTKLKSAPIASSDTYQVKSGDTLSGIAKRQGVKLTSLMQVNGLNNKSIIRPGQQLKLPKD
ncbi:transglycosylase SLT domain-containing protein [Shewanella sp.]|uniref:transglycosylase SLT domain-containing protein n=1 Tax=Shewanella sp. TaxID=50422 RepID=UPI0035689BF7